MDIFDVDILKIHSVKEGKHVVLVDCDTDCWGKTEHNKVCFHKYQWNRIKNKMSYKETEGVIFTVLTTMNSCLMKITTTDLREALKNTRMKNLLRKSTIELLTIYFIR